MKISELKQIIRDCPDDAEVFVDFPESTVVKVQQHLLDSEIVHLPIDSFSMSIEEVNTSWGDNNKVITIIPSEVIRC